MVGSQSLGGLGAVLSVVALVQWFHSFFTSPMLVSTILEDIFAWLSWFNRFSYKHSLAAKNDVPT